MSGKMVETRFTIQFSRTDPSHLQVADILNSQGRRSKAQYIVNAVLHYENCNETPHIPRTAELDVKVIEAVVNRILQDRAENNTEKATEYTSGQTKKTVLSAAEEISFDDALEALGANGINAIADTMELFRKK